VDKPKATEEANFGETLQWAVRICKKGRWLIAGATLFTVVGGNAAIRFIPPKYRSEATILVLGQQISTTFVTPLSSAPIEERTQVAAREALSQARLVEIVREFGLASADEPPESAVEALRKNIEIEPAGVSAFRVSFTARTPELAHGVASKLTDLFIQRNLALKTNQVRNATSLIQGQLAERRKKLTEIDARIESFKVQFGSELPEALPQNLDRWSQARTRLDSATISLDRANAQRAILQSTLIGNLNARLTHLREERTALLRNFTNKHPEVVAKEKDIAQMEAEVELIKSGTKMSGRQSNMFAADPMIAQLEGQLEANSLEIDNLTKEVARQTSTITDYQRHLQANPVREQQLSTMTRERQEVSEEITDLAKKGQQSDLSADMEMREQAQQFRLVDPPTMPTHPASKKRQSASLGALAAGPVLGLVLAFLLDFRKPTYQNENELRRAFAPPLVISVPVIPTQNELRKRTWLTAFELAAGCVVTLFIVAAEFYSYNVLA
jgi:succinoglycan biosynthesis transport protein ExoP